VTYDETGNMITPYNFAIERHTVRIYIRRQTNVSLIRGLTGMYQKE